MFHSQLPIWPAASARLRSRSLCRSCNGRGGECSGALGNARFELAVQLLELARLAKKLDENLDLRAQDLRDHRHRHVVDGTHFVAAQSIDVGQQNGGDEDQRGLLEARMIADHRRELETVDVRHVDVDENDGDVVLEQQLERLRGVAGAQQVLADVLREWPR